MKKNIFMGLSIVIVLNLIFFAGCSKTEDKVQEVLPISIQFYAPNVVTKADSSLAKGTDIEGMVTVDTLKLNGTYKFSFSVAAKAVNGISKASTLVKTFTGTTDTIAVNNFTASTWNTSNSPGYRDGYTDLGYTLSDSLNYQGTLYPSVTYIVKIIDDSDPQLIKYRKLIVQ
ncbi:MAG: hypothetical protein Q8904_01805 [Bacteroidota bacterium]|nr:hypothetical protein [Bacteroidota bacterium]